MAILTVVELKLAFDAERVVDLASDFSTLANEPTYDETIIEAIIAQSEDYVKAQLSKNYTTVQLEADKSIERITADIAMYYLELRRNLISPTIQTAFDRAIAFLQGLQNGTLKLEAVTQLLPQGNTIQPTEIIEDGFFSLTEEENDLLASQS